MEIKDASGLETIRCKAEEAESKSMEQESGVSGVQLGSQGSPISLCVEEYTKHKSVAKAAAAIGIRPDTLRKRLVIEARKKGLSDIRMLHGNLSSDSVAVTKAFLLELIEKQCYRCQLSGIELTPDNATLDHKVPVSKGGEHTAENVAWVDAEINRMKGQMSIDEFVSMCRKVTQYTR